MKSIDEIQAAVRNLPLTQTHLSALVGMAETFAVALKVEGGVVGAEDVCELLLDAYKACDDVWGETIESRRERETL